jgi:FMN phosphatase YigB (HAD superfamily)
MAPSFIYFDLADTLLEKPDLFPAIQRVLTRHQIVVEEKTLRRAHYRAREAQPFPPRTSQDFFRGFNARFLELLGVAADEALALEIFAACKNLPWRPFADVTALERLPVPYGILSNWDGTVEEKVRTLLPYPFRFVLGSHASGVAKPDLAFFRLATERAGVPPASLVFVGDSIALDVSPAAALGARAVLLDRFDVQPDFRGERVTSLHEIEKKVFAHG